MKRFCITAACAVFCSLAHATTINAPSSLIGSSVLDGQYAYAWGIPIALQSGQTIATASITFNNVTLTKANSSGTGYLYTDLINSTHTGVTGIYDGDASGDFFPTVLSKANITSLGTEFFASVGTTLSWTYLFNTTQLAALNTYLAAGIFNIGIDPDCHYSVGGLCFSYTTTTPHTSTPDVAMTSFLLGISLVGMEVFRRKLAPAK